MKHLYVYDIEALANFFCVVFERFDCDEKVVFEISAFKNELPELQYFIKNNVLAWWSYNGNAYDDNMMEMLLSKKSVTAEEIHEYSNYIIESEKAIYANLPFPSADIFKMLHFNRFGVSLKWCQVMMGSESIEESPIDFHEFIYGREIADKVIDYCKWDVSQTKKVIKNHPDDLALRAQLAKDYPQLKNPYSMSNTGMGKQTMLDDYCKLTGDSKWEVKQLRTEHTAIFAKQLIDPRIEFKTKPLQELLVRLKNSNVNLAFKAFTEYVYFDGVHYDLGKGGLHGVEGTRKKHGKKYSVDCRLMYEANDDFELIDFDFGSYYPGLLQKLRISPKHLNQSVFLKLIQDYTNDRLHYKAIGDKMKANALKIKINSLYGLLGDKHSFLYDLAAMYKVTINGQLLLLMLIERLSELGIKAFYANTDGVVFMVSKRLKQVFMDTCKAFNEVIEIPQEFANFQKCYIKDVNNFVIIKPDGSLKLKGCYAYKDDDRVKNGFPWYSSLPYNKNASNLVSSKAAVEYLAKNIPIRETLAKEDNILPFCIAIRAKSTPTKGMPKITWFENADRDRAQKLQRTVRYIISKTGGVLKLVYDDLSETHVEAHPHKNQFWNTQVLNKIDSFSTSDYDLNYDYYFREALKLCDFRLNHAQATVNQLTLF